MKIKDEKERQLKERFLKEEEARKRQLQVKIQIANDILLWGLIQSDTQLKEALQQKLSKSEKIKCLKSQLRFRKIVLGRAASDSKLFNFSVQEEGKRRQFTIDELKSRDKGRTSLCDTYTYIYCKKFVI